MTRTKADKTFMKKRTTCIAIAVVAIFAILLLNNPSEMMGQYTSVEGYLFLQADSNKAESLAVWETPYVVMADEPVEVDVIDKKLEYLEHHEELDENTTDGTLETWGYNWLIKIDASEVPQSSVILSARGMDEDGYFSQTTGQYVLVLHYPDGSYDILGEIPLLEAVDFLAQHNSGEQSIYALLQCE